MLRFILILLFSTQAIAEEVVFLEGMWAGFYTYEYESETYLIECSMVIEQEDNKIYGRMLETQTFGAESSVGLSSDLLGVAVAEGALIEKTYDGSAGVNHTVVYSLRLREEDELAGTWELDDQSGKLIMKRLTPSLIFKQ